MPHTLPVYIVQYCLVGELIDLPSNLYLLCESARLVFIPAVSDLAVQICSWWPICCPRATCHVLGAACFGSAKWDFFCAYAAVFRVRGYGRGAGESGVSLTDQGRPHSRRRQTFGSFTAGCGVGGVYPWQQGSSSSCEWSQQAT
jgi:hypothetical protein